MSIVLLISKAIYDFYIQQTTWKQLHETEPSVSFPCFYYSTGYNMSQYKQAECNPALYSD